MEGKQLEEALEHDGARKGVAVFASGDNKSAIIGSSIVQCPTCGAVPHEFCRGEFKHDVRAHEPKWCHQSRLAIVYGDKGIVYGIERPSYLDDTGIAADRGERERVAQSNPQPEHDAEREVAARLRRRIPNGVELVKLQSAWPDVIAYADLRLKIALAETIDAVAHELGVDSHWLRTLPQRMADRSGAPKPAVSPVELFGGGAHGSGSVADHPGIHAVSGAGGNSHVDLRDLYKQMSAIAGMLGQVIDRVVALESKVATVEQHIGPQPAASPR